MADAWEPNINHGLFVSNEDNFGKPQTVAATAFPAVPQTASTVALPTSFWVAFVGLLLQVLALMVYWGSNQDGALVAATVLFSSMILLGTLDCLFNTALKSSTSSTGLTLRILCLCTSVTCVVCGIGLVGYLFFGQDLHAEYRIDFFEPGLDADASVTTGTLQNGLKFYIKSNKFQKGLFTTMLGVDTGSTNEGDGQRGLAHFLEHMAFDKTVHFPRRGGLYSEVMKFGAAFNAFTSFRNTVFFFHKLEFNPDNLAKALFLHKNQVLFQDPNADNIDQERGAVLGEARMGNSTSHWSSNDVICFHFGDAFRPCKRFPIGVPEQVASFRPTDFRGYLSRWYHLNKMRLYVVGDFKDEQHGDVERVIREQFGGESTNASASKTVQDEPVIPSSPISPGRFQIKEFPNLKGVDVHLLVSSDYVTPLSSPEAVRRDTYNTLFSMIFQSQVVARFGHMYPEQLIAGTGMTHASASVDMEWSFNTTLYSMSVSTAGKPQQSTWKRDVEVAATELRLLAENGPDLDLLADKMDALLDDVKRGARKLKFDDHEDMATALMGNLDPAFRYVSPEAESRVTAAYLSPPLLPAAAEHVKTCAQVLYRALLEAVTNATYDAGDYSTLPSMRSSLSIYHGTTRTKTYLRKITKDNFARIVAGVHKKEMEPVKEGGMVVSFILPLLRSTHASSTSNSASELADTDFVLNFPKELEGPNSGGYQLVECDNATNVYRYILSNGVGVNVRPTVEGELKERGSLQLHIVALGGLATQTASLRGACHLVNTVKANGLSIGHSGHEHRDGGNKGGGDGDGGGGGKGGTRFRLATGRRRLGVTVFDDRFGDVWSWGGAAGGGWARTSLREMANRHEVAVHFEGSGDAAGDTAQENPSEEEGLQCEAEFLRIKVDLPVAECDTPEDEVLCEQDAKDYTSQLKFALGEMRPMYDERTVRLAYAEYEKQLDKLELGLEPDDVIIRTLLPQLASRAHPSDHRAQAPTLLDMKNIDALEVNRWVREHFVPGRYEINVAGDVAVDNLLKQLDDIFGVLPNITFSPTLDEDNITAGLLRQVGLDPYAAGDKDVFVRSFTSDKLREGCTLTSPVGGRGSVVHVVKAADYRASVDRPVLRRIADRCINRLLFLKVRRDGGYGYFVDVTPKHSIIFSGYGFYEVGWLAGQYSKGDGRYEFRVEQNVVASSAAVRDAFRSEVDETLFLEVVNTYVQGLNASYSSPAYWVSAMQGLSIHPPVSWPEFRPLASINITDVNQTRRGLNAIGNLNEVLALSKLTREDVNSHLREHSWDPQSYLWAVVVTRDPKDVAPSQDPECGMPVKIV